MCVWSGGGIYVFCDADHIVNIYMQGFISIYTSNSISTCNGESNPQIIFTLSY